MKIIANTLLHFLSTQPVYLVHNSDLDHVDRIYLEDDRVTLGMPVLSLVGACGLS